MNEVRCARHSVRLSLPCVAFSCVVQTNRDEEEEEEEEV